MQQTLWENYAPATCMPENCFCEAVHLESIIRQPMNTWSNLAFVLVGLVVAYLYKNNISINASNTSSNKQLNNYLNQFATYPMLFVFSCFVVGFGSLFYHASLTHIGQWIDNVGMYLVVSLFAVYNLDRVFVWGVNKGALVFVVANIIFSALAYYVPDTRRYLFAAIIAFYILTEFLGRARLNDTYQNKYLLAAVALFGTAFGIWIQDLNKQWCDADSLLQGHALWHMLDAMACFALYQYKSTQREAETSNLSEKGIATA